jgi:hypothetical protein
MSFPRSACPHEGGGGNPGINEWAQKGAKRHKVGPTGFEPLTLACKVTSCGANQVAEVT